MAQSAPHSAVNRHIEVGSTVWNAPAGSLFRRGVPNPRAKKQEKERAREGETADERGSGVWGLPAPLARSGAKQSEGGRDGGKERDSFLHIPEVLGKLVNTGPFAEAY